MNSPIQYALPVICLVFLASITRAEGKVSPIRDEAELFRADTLAKAEQQIGEIRRKYDRNLFVETVKSVPPSQRKWFHFLGTRQVNRILEEQARKLADESSADGIYVVICNDPKDIHVVVRPADDSLFTPRDGETLRRSIVRGFKDNDADQALLALVRQVQTTLQTNTTRGQSTAVVSEFVLAGLIGGGVGLWLVLCIVRYKMRARRAVRETEENAEEQARQTPALLGAMFGFPAGLWIYDKLYPRPVKVSFSLPERQTSAVLKGDGAEKTIVERPPLEERSEDAPMVP
jgi:TPM domain